MDGYISMTVGDATVELPMGDDPKMAFRMVTQRMWSHLTQDEYQNCLAQAKAANGSRAMLQPLDAYIDAGPFSRR